ncbi:DivIVA domain-containing protein [Plantactinospora soyae]|uniref:DivIVA domain-containing protein n=1 Tax=Plantactinospora soyae TaxID=1544732 RepID=A0A927MBB2_9ACTN|nr:DivIVA domain-containing protein [Plantactinospora soyae]MBE1490557.1 DivIVA domain-containing protein [Plantactinospora soyae]
MAHDPNFIVALRGYDMKQVRALLRQGEAALASDSPAERAAAAEALRRPTFTVRLRGYDRQQVEAYIGLLAERLAPR